MKKIMIIHHCGEIGGAGVSLLQTVNLLKRDYLVEVMCPANSDMYALLREEGISVLPYSFDLGQVPYYSGGPKIITRTFWKSIFNCYKYKRDVMEVLKSTDAELIIINSLTTSWIAKKVKKYTNKKVICFVRETFPKQGKLTMYTYFRRLLLSYCDKVLFISTYDKEFFLTSKEAIKGAVIKNTVPEKFYLNLISREDACNNLNLDYNKFNILFAGGMSSLKGTEIIVRAMQGLPEDVHLIIAGYYKGIINDYSKEVNSFIIKNKLNEKITFIGVQEDMTNAYSSCDLLVFPSIQPHQARPAFEAGAFKKPIIITGFPEIKEALDENNSNGLVFEPCNVNDLRSQILYLYTNRDLCEEMGRNNYIHSNVYHSEENVKKDLLKNIDIVLN